MNNLKKFATEAEYSAATLNYPAVSWIVSGDTVHFDKTAPAPTVNDKVIIASYGGTGETDFYFYNCEASSSSDITAITLDDVEVNPITSQTNTSAVDASQLHIAKYDLSVTTVGDWCSGELGCSQASLPANVEILIPSQITAIDYMPTNIIKLVIEAETPPTTSLPSSGYEDLQGIYVPDAALSAYEGIWGGTFYDRIYPISEYQGNLPV